MVFGFSEYSLRLFPVLCACASVLLMRHVTRRLFTGAPALLALAIFAVSYYPVRHAAELKPYATDLLASLVLTALAVEWLLESRPRWLWLFAAAAPIAVAVSYPAVFVAAGILAALAIPVWRRRDRRSALAWTAGAWLAGGAFASSFYLVAASHYQARSAAGMPMAGGFPPSGDPLGALRWLVQAHVGRTFAYPIGGEDGGSLLTFAAFAAGAIVLFRAGRRRLLAVLLTPFALGLVAAVLQRYPYGGSGRVSQYLVPAICLLTGAGAARLASLTRRPAIRRRVQLGVVACLVLFGVLLAAWPMVRPYRDRPDMAGRDFARWFWDVKSRDAELVCAWEDLRLELARPPARWVPGGAGYRIHQQIYSRRLRRGEAPDLTNITPRHPLRVVFQGSAVSRHRKALEEWLLEMQTRYELADREQFRLGGFEQQHGRGEWLELYTFVPHRSGAPAALWGDSTPPALGACAARGAWSRSFQPPAGTADVADCRSITGWAHDPDSALPTLVEVYKAGISAPVGAVCADLLRPELAAPGKLYGFHLWTPDVLKTGREEAFQVVAWDLGIHGNLLAPRQPLFRSQQTLTCRTDAASGAGARP